MIRVLIVDDSPVARELVRYIIGSAPDFTIVGMASNGAEAIRMVPEKRPDVITMDIHMPGMDGYSATRAIMERFPVPIVVVSASTSPEEVGGSFLALELGALAIFERPVGLSHPEFENQALALQNLVRAMAEVPVVRRAARKDIGGIAHRGHTSTTEKLTTRRQPAGVVCIGASTGGPQAIQAMLRNMDKPFPLPVLLVQHIAAGFLEGFVDWMVSSTGFPMRQAEHGEQLEQGVALVAPDSCCMEIRGNSRIHLVEGAHNCMIRPSVDHLFTSASLTFPGTSIGVLLSGMGRDGAEGLLKIRGAGGKTMAQERSTCVVYGMPGEAEKLGAAEQFFSPVRIGHRLNELATVIALR